MFNTNSNKEVKEVMTVEKARKELVAKRKFLAENANGEENIKRTAMVNVSRAEKNYLEALKTVQCPTTKVVFWNLTNETEEQVSITKKQDEIIIATSVYSMAVAKTNIELGKELITNEKFEKAPLYITDAKLFYDADIELKDLNGYVIDKGTPNVYVPVDSANGYWQWATYHEYNLNAIVKEENPLVIENVQVKQFNSLQEFAQYRGVNNVLSRGFNGLEKAGNAALATQQELFQKVFQKAVELNANVSVITKYYNLGKTINLKVWNSAAIGVIVEKFPEYNLNTGDKILEILQAKKFTAKTIKNRYLIDAITQLANLTPKEKTQKVGINEVIAVLESLTEESVTYINTITSDQVSNMYSELLTQYLTRNGATEEKLTA